MKRILWSFFLKYQSFLLLMIDIWDPSVLQREIWSLPKWMLYMNANNSLVPKFIFHRVLVVRRSLFWKSMGGNRRQHVRIVRTFSQIHQYMVLGHRPWRDLSSFNLCSHYLHVSRAIISSTFMFCLVFLFTNVGTSNQGLEHLKPWAQINPYT